MSGVDIKGLEVAFATPRGEVRPIRGLDLTIAPGRILGLVGESGSGKSTVALALMGLLAANARVGAGRLMLGAADHDLTRPDTLVPLRGTRIAMVFQDPFTALSPVFTVEAHLHEALSRREPGLPKAEARAKMIEALAAVGIPDPARLAQYPFQLSGGLRQRIAIAMALLVRPALLIADEPTTALDATVEAQVMAQITTLRDRIGCAVLLITHSLGLVTTWCDDIAVMYAGEMVESGPVAEVAHSPRHPYTRALLACEIDIDAPRGASPERFQVIPGELPNLLALPAGCIFASRCDMASPLCATAPPTETCGTHVIRCHHAGALP